MSENDPNFNKNKANSDEQTLSTVRDRHLDFVRETDSSTYRRRLPSLELDAADIVDENEGDSKTDHVDEKTVKSGPPKFTPAQKLRERRPQLSENDLFPQIDADIDEANRAGRDEQPEIDHITQIRLEESGFVRESADSVNRIPLQALAQLLEEKGNPRDIFRQDFGPPSDPHNLLRKKEPLTAHNYATLVKLPFKIKLTDQDLKQGLKVSTVSEDRKNATFPIPCKPQIPGVVILRKFGYPPNVASLSISPSGSIIVIWIILIAVILYAIFSFINL